MLPFAAGIVWQSYWPFSFSLLAGLTLTVIVLAVLYFLLPLTRRYTYAGVFGALLHLLTAAAGAWAVWPQDVRQHPQWLGRHYQTHHYLVAMLEEPLVQKPNSYKAQASVTRLVHNDSVQTVRGKIILYFKKDSSINHLNYGSQILITKPLQEIQNSDNPGSFHYKRYSLFQGITHQVYLTPKDFAGLPALNQKWWKKRLFETRAWVITLLKTHVDVLILSGNPRLYLNQLSQNLQIRQVVVDGSVPHWKARLWQRDCDSLKIPYQTYPKKGLLY